MTDIVERLRVLADKVNDQGEIYLAVCEIERLRAALSNCRKLREEELTQYNRSQR